ncbi:MAG: hypothetical protein JKY65_12460 [Planctomycetes bacterium]|nr:hypothetical protein [Planctomycetota bacterium]
MRTWEDPESTMGMGRDVGQIRTVTTLPGDSYDRVAYLGDDLVNLQGGILSLPLDRVRESLPAASRMELVDRGLVRLSDPGPLAGYGSAGFWRCAAADQLGGAAFVHLCGLPEFVSIRFPEQVNALAISKRHLYVGLRDGSILWVDARTGEQRQAVTLGPSPSV